MSAASTTVIALIAIALLLSLYLALRPSSTHGRGGKILAFVGIFALPLLAVTFGTDRHMQHSKSTEFCLSCHVMEPYGKSLMVDDAEFLPALHFQNNRIPREQACFTCHTEYTMYGDFSAKIRGLRHVWAQYAGAVPDTVKLYEPYRNRECLHCHAGARAFEEGGTHAGTPGLMDSIKADTKSCTSSGCHDVVHSVHELGEADMWAPRASGAQAPTTGEPTATRDTSALEDTSSSGVDTNTNGGGEDGTAD